VRQDIKAILAARETTHGDYTDQTNIIAGILAICQESKNWAVLDPAKRESLHMIAHKIGRILVGDPEIQDHWDDIAGYAKLAADRCKKPTPAPGLFFSPHLSGTPEDGGHYAKDTE
jgi:hypothetical protein